jgi:hypothetical protein
MVHLVLNSVLDAYISHKVDVPVTGSKDFDIPELFRVTRDDYETRILKLPHFKETVEFVVADFENPPAHYFMRLERSVYHATSLPQRISLVSSSRPARDSVRVSINEALLHHEAARGPAELVASISFGIQKPLLRKLSFVLELISNFVSEYRLFNHQCYWFCLAIMRALELDFEGAGVTHHPGFDRVGTFLGIPIPCGSKALKKLRRGLNTYAEGLLDVNSTLVIKA